MKVYCLLKDVALSLLLIEPRCEKTGFLHMRKQRQLISAFVFATPIVKSLFFLKPKFQASSYLLWLYSSVCVGPGRKPEDRFSHNKAQFNGYSKWRTYGSKCLYLASTKNYQRLACNTYMYLGHLRCSLI